MANIIMYGADWCGDCKRTKDFLEKNDQKFHFIDIEKDPDAAGYVEEINKGKRIIPTLEIDGKNYINPDEKTLAEALGVELGKDIQYHDVTIIGAGPTGLTASIYLQRDKFSTVLIEKKQIGGNAFYTQTIENYPGFTNISGPELMFKMAEQAQTYGAKIEMGKDVTAIEKHGDHFHVKTNRGEYHSKAVLIATGSTYKRLEIPGEEEQLGSKIHFCAACDGPFYADKDIVIVGGGNTALDEGIFLSSMVKSIKIVARSKEFSASKTYVDKLPSKENITTYMNKTSIEFTKDAEGSFQGLKVQDKDTGKEEVLQADGAFVFIGMIPNTEFLKSTDVKLDDYGFVITDKNGATDIEGIFAAGDCRNGAIAQIASATGEGVFASYGIKDFLKD